MSTTHIPAWKRLGLKLKYAKDTSSPPSEPTTTSRHESERKPSTKKRRLEQQTDGLQTRPAKAAKVNGTSSTPTSTTTNGNGNSHQEEPRPKDRKPKKQVSFTSDTKLTDGDTAVSIIPSEGDPAQSTLSSTTPPKNAKKPKKSKQPTPPAASKPSDTLSYLTQFYRSHSTWKFNKNRETWILKNLFDEARIPKGWNVALAQYVYGLKSQATRERVRMRCIAEGAKMGDSEDQAQGGDGDVRTRGDAREALKAFSREDGAGGIVQEGSELEKAFVGTGRVALVLWALDPAAAVGVGEGRSTAEKGAAAKKKRKNRTVVVEYSSSSSSSNSSESSSSESESEDSSTSSSDSSDSET